MSSNSQAFLISAQLYGPDVEEVLNDKTYRIFALCVGGGASFLIILIFLYFRIKDIYRFFKKRKKNINQPNGELVRKEANHQTKSFLSIQIFIPTNEEFESNSISNSLFTRSSNISQSTLSDYSFRSNESVNNFPVKIFTNI